MRPDYSTWPGWPANRTAIAAEVGINHGGDPELAWKMITTAHAHGADFVKLQTFHTEDFFHRSLDYYESTRRLELSDDAQIDLFTRAQAAGIALVTTPFDAQALALAERFAPPFHKIASMDADYGPHLERLAATGRPLVLSCGMAEMDEIDAAVRTVRDAGNDKLVLLHCVSDYPADNATLNLSMLPLLRETHGVPVGFSDHSLGLDGARVAASFGAALIEKHFTLDRAMARAMPDADHELSIEPDELASLRRFCEAVPTMMGKAPRQLTPNEQTGRRTFRRGLYAACDIAVGEKLDARNVAFLRPADGIPAGAWPKVLGRQTHRALAAGDLISFTDVGL